MPFAEIEKIKYAPPQVGADQVSIKTRRLPEKLGGGATRSSGWVAACSAA